MRYRIKVTTKGGNTIDKNIASCNKFCRICTVLLSEFSGKVSFVTWKIKKHKLKNCVYSHYFTQEMTEPFYAGEEYNRGKFGRTS